MMMMPCPSSALFAPGEAEALEADSEAPSEAEAPEEEAPPTTTTQATTAEAEAPPGEEEEALLTEGEADGLAALLRTAPAGSGGGVPRVVRERGAVPAHAAGAVRGLIVVRGLGCKKTWEQFCSSVVRALGACVVWARTARCGQRFGQKF
jgi:hypothetical protein